MPPVMEEIVEVLVEKIVKALQPLSQERTCERVADFYRVFEPLIKEEIVEMLELVPQEYSQELVVGQLGSFLFDTLSFRR